MFDPGKRLFQPASEGQRPSAAEHNAIVRAVQAVLGNRHDDLFFANLRILRLNEKMGKFALDTVNESYERESTNLWWKPDPVTDGIQENLDENFKLFSDPFDLIYDDDDTLIGWFSRQRGEFYPLNPRYVRHAITVADPCGNYPEKGASPDTYYIKFIKIDFADEPGASRISQSNLDASTCPDTTVHNIFDSSDPISYIPIGSLIQVYNVRGAWFTLWAWSSSDAETTTTTTPNPCAGRCRWVWNGTGGYWAKDTDECAEPTTTTSSTTTTTTTTSDPGSTTTSTSTTTTTTTPNPCECNSSTTTTTTVAGQPSRCSCNYPTFCLEEADDGAVTYTFCSQGAEETVSACNTTSTTTTTTCDCNTTTTSTTPEPCSGTCNYVSIPNYYGGWYWWLQTSDCTAGGNCSCAYPGAVATACVTTVMPCTSTPPPVITPIPCTGNCTFWWVPELGRWTQTHFGCAGNSTEPCYCVAPSEDGNGCYAVDTPCLSPTTTPSPCASCYPTTTSTSTTTTTTTTTYNPCGGGCLWESSGSLWFQTENTCAGECGCNYPPFSPTEAGEVIETPCSPHDPTTTTTTTSTTTTTTTSTTTTSTTEAPCDSSLTCNWSWNSVYKMWTQTKGCGYGGLACTGCRCQFPTSSGSYGGETTSTTCFCLDTYGCNNGCRWTADGTGTTWGLTVQNCAAPCGCIDVAYSPTYPFEVAETWCTTTPAP